MTDTRNYDCKHLTTTQRIKIEKGLNDSLSFAEIGRQIDKHRSTVTKEVKKYRYFVDRDLNSRPLRCARYRQCQMRFLCDVPDCIRPCKNCYDTKLNIPKCNLLCPDYLEPTCPTLQKAPFVCNGCSKRRACGCSSAG